MQNSTLEASQRPVRDHGPGPECAIRARGLAKSYRHPWTLKVTVGLEPLDLDVRRGEVIGLLGPNGAGKTTALKLLTGLIKPTAGHAWLLGESFDRPESRRKLGFLPEQPYFYDYLNGIEYLELAAGLSGLGAAEASQRAKHWLGRVGLGERPRLGLRKYSKGMLQRLGLAAALVHSPDLVILDEPMSGLDPFGRRDVRELIVEQREKGTTVLFSSHILPDVEMLCDRVAIVLKGKLTRVATVAELTHGDSHPVAIRCAGHPLVEIPAALTGAMERREHRGETEFMVRDGSRVADALEWATRAGLRVLAVTPQRQTLEELFMATAYGESATPPERESRSA